MTGRPSKRDHHLPAAFGLEDGGPRPAVDMEIRMKIAAGIVMFPRLVSLRLLAVIGRVFVARQGVTVGGWER